MKHDIDVEIGAHLTRLEGLQIVQAADERLHVLRMRELPSGVVPPHHDGLHVLRGDTLEGRHRRCPAPQRETHDCAGYPLRSSHLARFLSAAQLLSELQRYCAFWAVYLVRLRLPYDARSAGLSVTYQSVVKLALSEKYCHSTCLLPYWPAAYFCPNHHQGPRNISQDAAGRRVRSCNPSTLTRASHLDQLMIHNHRKTLRGSPAVYRIPRRLLDLLPVVHEGARSGGRELVAFEDDEGLTVEGELELDPAALDRYRRCASRP